MKNTEGPNIWPGSIKDKAIYGDVFTVWDERVVLYQDNDDYCLLIKSGPSERVLRFKRSEIEFLYGIIHVALNPDEVYF